MSERFQELGKIHKNLYYEGSPVIIEAGALYKDAENSEVLVQVKLRNISDKHISSCKILVRSFENNGQRLGDDIEHSFLDLDIANGETFGEKVPIYLADSNTRMISVAVSEIVFKDKQIWSSDEKSVWSPVEEPKKLIDELKDEELVQQYKVEVDIDAEYVPEKRRGLFLCACGAINLDNVGQCHNCGKSYEMLREKLNIEELSKASKERLANIKVEEDLKKKKELEAKAKTKKAVIICAVLLAIIFVAFIGIDFSKYQKGVGLLKAEKYDEALAQFQKVKVIDTSSQIKQIYQAQNYAEGIKCIESLQYSRAIEYFSLCGDYKDARQKADDIRPYVAIEEASKKMIEGDLIKARELLEGVPENIKSDVPEVSQYIGLIDEAIGSGWGGIWEFPTGVGDPIMYYVDLKIIGGEIYAQFTSHNIKFDLDLDMGMGKIEGNVVNIPGKDYTPRLISSKRMSVYGDDDTDGEFYKTETFEQMWQLRNMDK
ncbi:hypothetical protein D6855_14330 [Butyrivibrio sp. CB08]|uniref:hypothetical protein n=1 Tax=Butyrivibrio sp. CB08 TaxID=2364879 RepID=UPI000EA8771F|nr:hypothetical protein [Butyrivibrio sp. CB08]RKM56842.1 hypothetical protein D6855_14330 [Butyrivibrio sp. CB08]